MTQKCGAVRKGTSVTRLEARGFEVEKLLCCRSAARSTYLYLEKKTSHNAVHFHIPTSVHISHLTCAVVHGFFPGLTAAWPSRLAPEEKCLVLARRLLYSKPICGSKDLGFSFSSVKKVGPIAACLGVNCSLIWRSAKTSIEKMLSRWLLGTCTFIGRSHTRTYPISLNRSSTLRFELGMELIPGSRLSAIN